MHGTPTAIDLQCFVPGSFGMAGLGYGMLGGRKFVVKDLIAVAGHAPSFGNQRWRETHHKSGTTAPAVMKLLGAGADLVGMAKMDQLAYSLVGNVGEGQQPINPMYKDRFAGGSSSGVASAVGGGLADFGIGTDTGGSIRVPAACCGLFSIRPTHGCIDMTGVIPMAQSFDVIGIMAREPMLLSAAFDAVRSGNMNKPSPIEKVLLPNDCLQMVDPKVARITKKAAAALSGLLYAKAEDIKFGEMASEDTAELYTRLQGREVWANHSEWVSDNMKFIADDVRTRLGRAERLSAAKGEEKLRDGEALVKYRAEYDRLVKKGEVVVMPVMAGLPPMRNASAEDLLGFRKAALCLNSPASLAGAPEVVIPVKDSSSGLTYGIGILGPRNEDVSIMNSVVSALGSFNGMEI